MGLSCCGALCHLRNTKLHNAECLTFESWNHSQVLKLFTFFGHFVFVTLTSYLKFLLKNKYLVLLLSIV